jgi:hypothetical protein
MPRGPRGERRPADVIGAAVRVARTAAAYLPLYVNEFEFRHNTRDVKDPFGLLIASC